MPSRLKCVRRQTSVSVAAGRTFDRRQVIISGAVPITPSHLTLLPHSSSPERQPPRRDRSAHVSADQKPKPWCRGRDLNPHQACSAVISSCVLCSAVGCNWLQLKVGVDGGHTSLGSKIRLEIVCSRWAHRGENHSQTDLGLVQTLASLCPKCQQFTPDEVSESDGAGEVILPEDGPCSEGGQ